MSIIDTPDAIARFALLQIYYKLRLEVDNPIMKWRMSPKLQAIAAMENNGYEAPRKTARRKTVLEAYKLFLASNGIEPNELLKKK